MRDRHRRIRRHGHRRHLRMMRWRRRRLKIRWRRRIVWGAAPRKRVHIHLGGCVDNALHKKYVPHAHTRNSNFELCITLYYHITTRLKDRTHTQRSGEQQQPPRWHCRRLVFAPDSTREQILSHGGSSAVCTTTSAGPHYRTRERVSHPRCRGALLGQRARA